MPLQSCPRRRRLRRPPLACLPVLLRNRQRRQRRHCPLRCRGLLPPRRRPRARSPALARSRQRLRWPRCLLRQRRQPIHQVLLGTLLLPRWGRGQAKRRLGLPQRRPPLPPLTLRLLRQQACPRRQRRMDLQLTLLLPPALTPLRRLRRAACWLLRLRHRRLFQPWLRLRHLRRAPWGPRSALL